MSNQAKPFSPPLFNWLTTRSAGVLLHPTSLPGEFGIGTLGAEAGAFLAFLADAGFSHWQTCPLGPTGYGDSPYQSFSAFAGNPYLIDLLELSSLGLVPQDSLGPLLFLSSDRVDFGALHKLKWPVLFQAFETFAKDPARPLPYGDFAAFRQHHASWLDGYAYFQALKDHFQGCPWWEWPDTYRVCAKAATAPLRQKLATRADAHAFFQYLFFGQWARVKALAARSGIAIIGDIPIFVAMDSADAWANPALFQFEAATLRPRAVAGCPPDYFSVDGQLWGNPLYDWPVHAADGYAWWRARLRASFALCDVLRIDHFRGFESYWAIPHGCPTARTGRWEPGPGLDFFSAVKKAFPEAKIIAEDLGFLTPEVLKLRDDTGLPGMAVLQFAFGDKADNFYLPHNLHANSVVYPGTHDNDTTLGWYASADEKTRDHARRYLRISGAEINWDFVRTAYAAPSRLAIFPLQDLLNLGSEARFNTPGRSGGNWTWRYRPAQLQQLLGRTSAYLRELAVLYGRLEEKSGGNASK